MRKRQRKLGCLEEPGCPQHSHYEISWLASYPGTTGIHGVPVPSIGTTYVISMLCPIADLVRMMIRRGTRLRRFKAVCLMRSIGTLADIRQRCDEARHHPDPPLIIAICVGCKRRSNAVR